MKKWISRIGRLVLGSIPSMMGIATGIALGNWIVGHIQYVDNDEIVVPIEQVEYAGCPEESYYLNLNSDTLYVLKTNNSDVTLTDSELKALAYFAQADLKEGSMSDCANDTVTTPCCPVEIPPATDRIEFRYDIEDTTFYEAWELLGDQFVCTRKGKHWR